MSENKNAAPEGFTLAYAADAGEFRFYVSAFIVLASLVALIFMGGGAVAFALIVCFGSVAYYFYPLIEKKKPRIGAGQYGIFIDGFGIIGWRAVEDIALRRYAVRSIDNVEIHIKLSQPLDQALLINWHKLPFYRVLMMLPWHRGPDNVVRISLLTFAPKPELIFDRFIKAWNMFGKNEASRR